MEDRGKYKACEECGRYLWEAHSSGGKRHLCAHCFLDSPNPINHKQSVRNFKDRWNQLIKDGVIHEEPIV
jgi:hypothetical protein